MGPGDDLLQKNENIERIRAEMRLHRRIGIKVKLEFDSPQWWTVDFIRHTETIATQRQIAAAKSSVKSGSVVELVVNSGVVEAKVQGSRKAPYHVRIYTPQPTPEQIANIKAKLAERAIYGALLLAGEMPEAVSGIFKDCGVGLVPQDFAKTKMLCSCPEPDSVCKHILAVMLALTDAFDRDPFLLLRMRGIEKEDLLASLTAHRGGSQAASALADRGEDLADAIDASADEPSSSGSSVATLSAAEFFAPSGLSKVLAASRTRAGDDSTHPPVFDFPLWRGETSFKDSMYPYYDTVRKMLR